MYQYGLILILEQQYQKTYFTRVIEISDEQAELPIDELKRMNLKQEEPEDVQTIKLKLRRMLKLLERIIETSHHVGERNNSKDLYLKIMGKKYSGQEYKE